MKKKLDKQEEKAHEQLVERISMAYDSAEFP